MIGDDAFAAGALAAAGVSPVGIVAPDAPALAARLGLLHPGVLFEPYPVAIGEADAVAIAGAADLVVDVSQDEAARLAANDACRAAGVAFVTAVLGGEGALVLSAPGPADGCWRCLADGPAPGAPMAGIGPLASALAVATGLAGGAGVLELGGATPSVIPQPVPVRPGCAACAPQSG